jgi:hypothetical protein
VIVGLPFIEWHSRRTMRAKYLTWLRKCLAKNEPTWLGRAEAILDTYHGQESLLVTEMQHRYRHRLGGTGGAPAS